MIKKFLGFIVTLLLVSDICGQGNPLPFGRTTLFAGSGSCAICHVSDGSALTLNGVDVSPSTYWRSTMMANASKDPLWRAFVAEEVHNFPQLKETIETTCTRCHAPMGYTEAEFKGQKNYSMAELKADPIANDGVSCTVCHQIKPDNFGSQNSYSGNYIINHDSLIYGPYENPETQSMINSFAFKPVYSNHLNQSELCATCHTLFTPFLDNQGQIAGEFPEQTPYIEWKNSIYPAQNIQCQDCHMPKTYEPIDIANIPPTHNVLRTPYWKHNFVGANVYMLRLLKNNINTIGITASPENFDSTIARAQDNLENLALDLNLNTNYQNDSLNVFVRIDNKTGHKLPTGIPLRRMWIHLKVTDPSENIIFESGNWDTNGEIAGLDTDFEPHYDLITNQDEVQIYEGVFVDVDKNVTYTLLRASEYIKDNRIPPKGFRTSHPGYDTTAIYGSAISDQNFNKDDALTEGTGSDIVTYRFPAFGGVEYTVKAEVCIQTIKPKVVEHLASIDEPDINQFVGMYNNTPNIPYIMKMKTVAAVTNVNESTLSVSNIYLSQNFPNPFNTSTKFEYMIPRASFVTIKVFDVMGREIKTLVDDYREAGRYEIEFNTDKAGINLSSGIYYYKLKVGTSSEIKKMLLLK